ncbi:MAG: hypothetical protein HUK05_05000 [Prevotella sp.]|nr:hypothetical protein [Prevotella sp.]
MKDAVIQQIKAKITRAKYGEVFMVSSFPKFNVEYVTKLLADFEKESLITRIAKGIYVKARKTQFGILYPTATEIVFQIAKRDRAKIIATGQTAENKLGFSTQIPMNTCFLTSGTPRQLKLGNKMVTLKHGVPKNFAYKGKLMPELVQALRSIGEGNITDEDEKRIRQLLSTHPEDHTFDHDILLAPVWVRNLITKNRRHNNE